jgi:hypothetical protein
MEHKWPTGFEVVFSLFGSQCTVLKQLSLIGCILVWRRDGFLCCIQTFVSR